MPASNYDSYLHDARNNFDAVRPVPICTDANQSMGQCLNVHVSTNCYYGYQNLKNNTENNHVDTDCEMVELDRVRNNIKSKTITKKRSADEEDYPQSKRHRDEVQREKNIEPETNENLDTNTEDLLESLFWNIHGGNIFHLIQCL